MYPPLHARVAGKTSENPRCQEIRRDIENMQRERSKLIDQRNALFHERDRIKARKLELDAEAAATMINTGLSGGDSGTAYEVLHREAERKKLNARLSQIEREIRALIQATDRKVDDIKKMAQGLTIYGCR